MMKFLNSLIVMSIFATPATIPVLAATDGQASITGDMTLEATCDEQQSTTQTIQLGGQGIGDYTSGFARVTLEAQDNTVTLIKNSDYQFHWSGWQSSTYASIKITDPNGTVLYDRAWKGSDSVDDLEYGKFGVFAQFDLSEGSTVEVYHAEGPWHRFNTNDNDSLKTKLGVNGYTYTYTVKNNQLVLTKVDETHSINQVIQLGGQRVGDSPFEFARVILEVQDHKLTLIKNSDYEFHWDKWQSSTYASIKVTDPNGTVLYDRAWKGSDSVDDLEYGEFGIFAQVDVPEGSTVEVYHAEGSSERFNTNDNDSLKTELGVTGCTYTYTMQNNQLVLTNVQ